MQTDLSASQMHCIKNAVARAVINDLPPSWISVCMSLGTSPEALDCAVDTAIQLHNLVLKHYGRG